MKIFKQITCKHEYHNIRVYNVYENGVRKKVSMYKCIKCNKIKKISKEVKHRLSLNKVSL